MCVLIAFRWLYRDTFFSQAHLASVTSTLEEVNQLRPATGSLFVRLFLGQVR